MPFFLLFSRFVSGDHWVRSGMTARQTAIPMILSFAHHRFRSKIPIPPQKRKEGQREDDGPDTKLPAPVLRGYRASRHLPADDFLLAFAFVHRGSWGEEYTPTILCRISVCISPRRAGGCVSRGRKGRVEAYVAAAGSRRHGRDGGSARLAGVPATSSCSPFDCRACLLGRRRLLRGTVPYWMEGCPQVTRACSRFASVARGPWS